MSNLHLGLVSGYGINLNHLNWKDEKEIQKIIDEEQYKSLDKYIENTAHRDLVCVRINGGWYLYTHNILPARFHVEVAKIWTDEELATEIHRSIGALVEDSKDDIQKKIDCVFDWEVYDMDNYEPSGYAIVCHYTKKG